jgi:ribosome recycling factor
MSGDDEKKFSDQIQKLTDATINEIDQLLASKEAEITQV